MRVPKPPKFTICSRKLAKDGKCFVVEYKFGRKWYKMKPVKTREQAKKITKHFFHLSAHPYGKHTDYKIKKST